MEKKKLIYIVGGIAVIGLVYYFYNKNKKPIGANPNAPTQGQPETEEATKETEKTDKSVADKKAKPKPVKKDFGTPSKSDGKKYMAVCGKRPLIKGNRPMWEACVNEQKAKESEKGKSAFDGASDYFEIKSNMSGNITDNMDIF